jgi:hypothetical protein
MRQKRGSKRCSLQVERSRSSRIWEVDELAWKVRIRQSDFDIHLDFAQRRNSYLSKSIYRRDLDHREQVLRR